MRVWFQYVASKANVSDLPSRDAQVELQDVLSRFSDCDIESVEMVIPPFDRWDAPFSFWLEHVAGPPSLPVRGAVSTRDTLLSHVVL